MAPRARRGGRRARHVRDCCVAAWTADACVIPEPTGLDVVPANAGALTFRLRVPGRADATPRGAPRASARSSKFVPVLAALRALEPRRNARRGPADARDGRSPTRCPSARCTPATGPRPCPTCSSPRAASASRSASRSSRRARRARAGRRRALRRRRLAARPPGHGQWWGGQFAPGSGTGAPAESDALVERVGRAHVRALPGARPQEVYAAPYGSDLRLIAPTMPVLQYGPGDTRHRPRPRRERPGRALPRRRPRARPALPRPLRPRLTRTS